MLSIIRKFNLPTEFPRNVLDEVSGIPTRVEARMLEGREDLRKQFIVTVDPDDARDFDDAINVEKIDNQGWQLGVHIADVAAYVQPGNALDREARKRGNSVYLPDRVIPMLPEQLSNGVCSLNPGVDRLTHSVFIQFDKNGRAKNVRFARSVIRSAHRLTYKEAYALLKSPPKDELGKRMQEAWKLASLLRRKRFEHGSLDLDFPEVKVHVDPNGKPVKLERVENDESHQLIEEFMLAANEAVAREMRHREIPTVYRVHENPDPEKLAEYRELVLSHNYKVGDLTHRSELQRFLASLRGKPEEQALKIGLLKSLKRARYAPTFAEWDSVGGDTTWAQFKNLTTDQIYIFVVVGFDEAGAYSPVWSTSINMLQLFVTFAGNNGPILSIFNEFFNYRYPSGAYSVDPSRYINLEVPARQPVHFNWSAEAPNGSQMKQYRWSMDMTNLEDQTKRSDERTDLKHWSQWGLNNISATVGPFFSDTTHIFFIEAEDINGLKSLGIVSFRVVVPTFNHDLLIVNDTRLTVDQKVLNPPPSSPDSLGVPAGAWPSRSELDTFLFARGGVRWRMTPNGTLSPPGIFAGYKYDTAYTAAGGTNGFVTLDTLGRYKHVLWITDVNSATATKGAGVLRGMSEKGRANTLAAYVALGGQLWLAGGTSIRATMLPWNLAKNDLEPPFNILKFSVTPTVNGRAAELGPGRMVFDEANWKSDIWLTTASEQTILHKSVRAVGNYPSRMDPRWGLVRSPDYSLLPVRLGRKNAADDPVPPNRGKASFFNAVLVFNLEFMTDANPGLLTNAILEDTDPDPDVENNVSMLDTLLIASLNISGIPIENEDLSLGGRNYRSFPVMTYYHGQFGPPFVLSGHDIWTFTRKDLVKLVDFVFQQIWGMPKEPIVAPAIQAPAPAAPVRAPAAPARTAARVRR